MLGLGKFLHFDLLDDEGLDDPEAADTVVD